MTDDKFPLDELREAGYATAPSSARNVQRRRHHEPPARARRGEEHRRFEDEHSRVIAATVDGPNGEVRIVNGYFVNGQAPGSEKFAYKMNWLRGLTTTCAMN